MPTKHAAWLELLGAALIAGGVMLPAAAEPKHHAVQSAAQPPVLCSGAVQHPLSVKAAALDPLRRGEIVRVRVTTTSRIALERGDVRLVSTGGAALVGPARVPFEQLTPGAAGTTEFAVRLPAEGKRFLLQFRVAGDGPSGLAARGATLNLLPEGPADPGRLVTSDAGERIVEYRARRIK